MVYNEHMRTCIAALLISCVAAQAGSLANLSVVTDRLMPSNAVNVVTYAAPRAVSIGDLGLKEAGLAAAPVIMQADEVRIFANREAMGARPKARLWRNSREGGAWWYQTGGEGLADAHVIQPGEAVVILTRGSTNALVWKNPLAATPGE